MKKLGIDSLIYTGGIFLNSILGLVFFVLIARVLGPSQFGIASVIIAISIITADIFDLGLSPSMLKFLSAAPDEEKKEISSDFFGYKLVTAFLAILIGLVASPFLANFLFRTAALWPEVWLGFLAAAGFIVYNYVNANFQARKRFISSATFSVISNSLRLLMTVYFFALGRLDINSTLVAYTIALFGVALAWGLIDSHISFRPRLTKNIFLPVFKFGRWMAGSQAVASVTSRLDNFLLVSLTSTFQTGIYTSVQRLFLAFNNIPAGISLVLTPELSSKNETRTNHALAFGLLAAGLLTVGLFIFIFLAPWLVPLLLGPGFASSVLPSQFLALGTVFFVLASPLNSFILYTKEASHRLFALAVIQLGSTIIFNWLLIPPFQAAGAALAYAAVSFVSLFVSLFFFTR